MLGGSVAAGSYGLRRADVKASGAAGPLAYVLSAGRLSSQGFRAHSAAEREGGNARLDWALGDDSKLTLLANILAVDAQDPLGLSRTQFDAAPRSADSAATTFNTRKAVSQRQIGAVYERKIDADRQLRLMLYGGERSTTQFQAIPVAVQANPQHPGGVIGLDRNYGGLDLRWTTRTALAERPLEIVGGLAYDAMNEQRRGWQNFQGTALGVQGRCGAMKTTASAASTLICRPPGSPARAGPSTRACATAWCAFRRATATLSAPTAMTVAACLTAPRCLPQG